MNIIFPIIELVDRYCIAKLKMNKTQSNSEELEFYQMQLENITIDIIDKDLDELYDIHLAIWDLESLLKSGLEYQVGLEEIGRRAIMIRNLNNQRIALKNKMAEKLECNIREIKKDHLSQ